MNIPDVLLLFGLLYGMEWKTNNIEVPINDKIDPKQNINDEILSIDAYCNQYKKLKNENTDNSIDNINIRGRQ